MDASATSPEPDDIRALVLDLLAVEGVPPATIDYVAAELAAATWPGDVRVSVLSRELDGTASPDLIDAVTAKLAADDVRPLTDNVTVQSAGIVPYSIVAEIFTYPGPDSAVVLAEVNARIQKYVADSHRIGRDVALSAIYAALHAEGVQRVELTSPSENIVIDATQAPYCEEITITHGGTGD